MSTGLCPDCGKRCKAFASNLKCQAAERAADSRKRAADSRKRAADTSDLLDTIRKAGYAVEGANKVERGQSVGTEWVVTRSPIGQSCILSRHPTKEAAISEARRLAQVSRLAGPVEGVDYQVREPEDRRTQPRRDLSRTPRAMRKWARLDKLTEIGDWWSDGVIVVRKAHLPATSKRSLAALPEPVRDLGREDLLRGFLRAVVDAKSRGLFVPTFMDRVSQGMPFAVVPSAAGAMRFHIDPLLWMLRAFPQAKLWVRHDRPEGTQRCLIWIGQRCELLGVAVPYTVLPSTAARG